MTERLLIDSNVLVYAYDKTSEKHETALKILERVMADESGVLSIQNLVEFARLVTEKLPKKISFEQARSIVLGLADSFEVVYYDPHAIARALAMCGSEKIHFFDALISATMEKEKIRIIITENEKDFKKIPWIEVVNPFK